MATALTCAESLAAPAPAVDIRALMTWGEVHAHMNDDLEAATGEAASPRARKWRSEFEALAERLFTLEGGSEEFHETLDQMGEIADRLNALRSIFHDRIVPYARNPELAQECEALDERFMDFNRKASVSITFKPWYLGSGRWNDGGIMVNAHLGADHLKNVRPGELRSKVAEALRKQAARLLETADELEVS